MQAWLVTIGRRKAIDVIRSRARAPLPVSDVRIAAAATHIAAAEPGGGLWEAVRELPDKQRQVIAYHHLVGLPYQEIAEILGGTADSARRAAADGIRALRRGRLPREDRS